MVSSRASACDVLPLSVSAAICSSASSSSASALSTASATGGVFSVSMAAEAISFSWLQVRLHCTRTDKFRLSRLSDKSSSSSRHCSSS